MKFPVIQVDLTEAVLAEFDRKVEAMRRQVNDASEAMAGKMPRELDLVLWDSFWDTFNKEVAIQRTAMKARLEEMIKRTALE